MYVLGAVLKFIGLTLSVKSPAVIQTDVVAQGTYLLLLECRIKTRLSIGKLGRMMVMPGYYVYVGSAFGPGGISARVRHHSEIAARPHWHIDYLRTGAELVDIWCIYGSRCEHQWAQSLMHKPITTVPLKGFGASDCDCATHLFYFAHRPQKSELETLLQTRLEIVDGFDSR